MVRRRTLRPQAKKFTTSCSVDYWFLQPLLLTSGSTSKKQKQRQQSQSSVSLCGIVIPVQFKRNGRGEGGGGGLGGRVTRAELKHLQSLQYPFNIFNIPSIFVTFPKIYLATIWYATSLSIKFSVSVTTIFWQARFFQHYLDVFKFYVIVVFSLLYNFPS